MSPTDTNMAFYVQQFTGNVGIGTGNPEAQLDVVGGVKIGNDTRICNSTIAGTMRYNSGAMQYCDGTTWQGVGGGGIVPTGLYGLCELDGSGMCGTVLPPAYCTGLCQCPVGYSVVITGGGTSLYYSCYKN